MGSFQVECTRVLTRNLHTLLRSLNVAVTESHRVNWEKLPTIRYKMFLQGPRKSLCEAGYHPESTAPITKRESRPNALCTKKRLGKKQRAQSTESPLLSCPSTHRQADSLEGAIYHAVCVFSVRYPRRPDWRNSFSSNNARTAPVTQHNALLDFPHSKAFTTSQTSAHCGLGTHSYK